MLDIKKAVAYSDAHLKEIGKTRTWVAAFAKSAVPQGLDPDTGDVSNDAAFIEYVQDVQAFVFGDDGDKLLGVPAQPATEAEVDGFLGSATTRRMDAWEDAQQPNVVNPVPDATGVDHLLWDGVPFEVRGVRVITLQEPGGIDLYRMATRKPIKWPAKERGAWSVLATDHWDVCTSAHKCAQVLTSVGYSSNFGIDNPTPDGIATVYLWLDPGVFRGAHAGSPGNNVSGLSFDYSNAVDIGKYGKLYEQKVGVPRPIIRASVHGRSKQFLGMYAGQVIAGMRVKQAYAGRVGVPFIRPLDVKGMPFQTVLTGLGKGIFRGAVTHLNWTLQKWDVAGLVEQEIALLLHYPQLQKEFPAYVSHLRLQESRWQDWLAEIKADWIWSEVFGSGGVHLSVNL